MSVPTLNRRAALRLIGAGALATAGLTTTACAPSTSSPAGGKPADDGSKDFTFTAWSLNEEATKAPLQSLLDGYATTAGGKIKTASYPFNEYLNQVLLQVRGGSLTGAVQLDVAWLATLAATGKLTDLGEFAKAGYTEQALKAGQVDGKQYALPWTSAGIGLIANRELLDKAKVGTEPKTIAEFEETLRALKGQGVIPYAGMTKVAQLKDFVAWMWTFGAELVTDGRITVGDEGSVAALTWYKKLYDDKLIAPDVDRFDARALMSQGKAAFYEDAIGGRKAVTTASTDKQLGDKLVPVPRPVNGSGTAQHLAWGHVIAVLSGSGAASAARFAQAVTSDVKYTLPWFTAAGLPPTTTAGLGASQVAADTFTVQFTERIGARTRPSPLWVFPQYAQMEQALATQVQAVLVGQASPKDALATAREQMQRLAT